MTERAPDGSLMRIAFLRKKREYENRFRFQMQSRIGAFVMTLFSGEEGLDMQRSQQRCEMMKTNPGGFWVAFRRMR